MSPRPANATRTDIITLLQEGHSNTRISRELHCDKTRVARIRTELGLPTFTPTEQARTIQEKWTQHTRPLDGGHLEWTGERATRSGTPVMRYKEQYYSPAAVAFETKHDRQPEGYVRAECGRPHCVAPDHVNDEAGRRQARQAIRAQRGLGDAPAVCGAGHDQTVHGKYGTDGVAYCGLCKLLDKRAQCDPSRPRPHRYRPATLEEAFRVHTEPLDEGHLLWTGSAQHTTPVVWFAGSLRSANKVGFLLHYGRDPEGTVTSSCPVPMCVAGVHLVDRQMRQRERQLDRLYAGIFGGAS
jgi:hypothetical protein